jgi:leucyl-tRNA synthetase
VPIWIADYVLISYGTGAIMAVPAHDTATSSSPSSSKSRSSRWSIRATIDPQEVDRDACWPAAPVLRATGTAINSGDYDG